MKNFFAILSFALVLGFSSTALASGSPPHDGIQILDVIHFDAKDVGKDCIKVTYLTITGIERIVWMTKHQYALFQKSVVRNQMRDLQKKELQQKSLQEQTEQEEVAKEEVAKEKVTKEKVTKKKKSKKKN